MQKNEDFSDAYLVELVKNDSEKLGLIIERYRWQLFHYIRRIAQLQKEDVDDLLQDIFIKVYKKINEYNEELKFSSWIYRIAHNAIIDHIRKTNARPKTNMLEDSEWEKIIESSIHIEKSIIDRECIENIKKSINELPLNYKEVLVLRFVEEKEYEEIMDILKKPKGTVATLIARGKNMLLVKLKEKNINCF